MEFHVPVPGPFTYLVHEHARSILAIQELQREVTSLLEFRENVLCALPHLHARGYHSLTPTTHDPRHLPAHAPTPHASPPGKAQGGGVRTATTTTAATTTSGTASSSSSSSGGGKSLSEGHSSAVADSGFSTDKAGGSMGKSSSSSGGADHLSGPDDHRWTSVEPEAPLGSAEDELWHLLDVIQRKGTRLRHELDCAERVERDRHHHPPASDPPPASPRPHPAYRDLWPHSLPGPLGAYPSRGDFLPPPPGMGLGGEGEAWAAVERLRSDRQYLVGRVSWAEGEAAASHQRLLDLHDQLLALAGDKRRLEDQVRALRLDPRLDPRQDLNLQFVKAQGLRRDGPVSTGGVVHSVTGGVNTVTIDHTTAATRPRKPSVTVSVAAGDGPEESPGARRMTRTASSVRLNPADRDPVLPRVLKVPIRDRHLRKESKDATTPSTKDTTKEPMVSSEGRMVSSEGRKGSDRVVIERERSAGRADGGLSMPVSLLKGGRVKVTPNKQRISAILREKDVLELQRQLLTTVMETEVLKKQIETAGEEWGVKTSEWEVEQRQHQSTISALRQENLGLKAQVDGGNARVRVDAAVYAVPGVCSVGTMTEVYGDEGEAASHTVHPGPNVGYDVVVHEDAREPNNNTAAPPLEPRKAPPGVEKPPRRTRDPRTPPAAWPPHHHILPSSSHRETLSPEVAGHRETLGRGVGARMRPSLTASARSTPTATPRSSPAPSITARTPAPRTSLGDAARASPVSRTSLGDAARASPVSRSSSSVGRVAMARRDSVKSGGGGKSGGASGQHKDISLRVRDKGGVGRPRSVMGMRESSPHQSSPSPAVASLASPLTINDLLPLPNSGAASSSLESVGPPLALSDLGTPTPKKLSVLSQIQEMTSSGGRRSKTSARKQLSASDLYNKDDEGGSVLWQETSPDTGDTIALVSDPSGSLASSGSFYDSINTDSDIGEDPSQLMHVEVAFDWTPVPTQEIRYLPPAAHMWNASHTLSPDKRLPVMGSRALSAASARWPTSTNRPASTDSPTRNRKLGLARAESSESVDSHESQLGPADSLEDEEQSGFEAMGRMRHKLRAINGAVRVKSVDRPSVLNLVHSEGQRGMSPAPQAIQGAQRYPGQPATTPRYTRLDDSANVSTNPRMMRHLHARTLRSSPIHTAGTDISSQSSAELNARVHQILSRIAASAQ